MSASVTQDLSFISMVSHASVIVQLVMLGLLAASMFSWWLIFLKGFAIRKAVRQTQQFEQEFWSGSDLNALYQRASSAHGNGGAM